MTENMSQPVFVVVDEELLARGRSAHPYGRRILLIDYNDQRMLDVIAQGMAIDNVEYYLTKTWRPRQHLPGSVRRRCRVSAAGRGRGYRLSAGQAHPARGQVTLAARG